MKNTNSRLRRKKWFYAIIIILLLIAKGNYRAGWMMKYFDKDFERFPFQIWGLIGLFIGLLMVEFERKDKNKKDGNND